MAEPPPELSIGQVVLSKAGRDRGKAFVILAGDNNGFVLLVDGSVRRVAKPKRKNVKHLQPVGQIARELLAKVKAGKVPTDAEIRRALTALTDGEKQPDPQGEEEVDGQKGCH